MIFTDLYPFLQGLENTYIQINRKINVIENNSLACYIYSGDIVILGKSKKEE